jgi:hypothetical protein
MHLLEVIMVFEGVIVNGSNGAFTNISGVKLPMNVDGVFGILMGILGCMFIGCTGNIIVYRGSSCL